MTTIGYIRQSKRADLDLALSYDAQLAAIRRLASDDIEVLSDMGRSGKAGGERLRPGYQRLVAGIEDGTYTEVYALNLARLARSVPELHRLMTLAKAHGVKIITAKEGLLDPTTTTGRLTFGIFALLAEFVRDLAVDAANENVAERRKRGERMGRIPYGDRPGDKPDAVLAAYREAGGSLNATALLLNQRRVTSWNGGDWTGPAVRLVIKRLVPGVIPNRAMRGVKPTSPFLLYRLLRCPCGRIMTASRDGRGNREPLYRCHAADTLPDHQRPYRVRESVVLPWLHGEAARLRVPGDKLEELATNEAKRTRLEDQRRAVGDALIVRAYSVAQAAAKVAEIEAALAALDTERQVHDIGPVDWSMRPENLNPVLRALWEYVQLGPDLLPVSAVWRVKEWRS